MSKQRWQFGGLVVFVFLLLLVFFSGSLLKGTSTGVTYTKAQILEELIRFDRLLTISPTESVGFLNCNYDKCEKASYATSGGFFWPMYGAASIVNNLQKNDSDLSTKNSLEIANGM